MIRNIVHVSKYMHCVEYYTFQIYMGGLFGLFGQGASICDGLACLWHAMNIINFKGLWRAIDE